MPSTASERKILAVDTEDTGVDHYHGAKPFLISFCDDKECWAKEWLVDPYTRQPKIKREDLDEALHTISTAEELWLQNGKFDVAAIKTIAPEFEWPWHKTYDTILGGHLLNSRGKRSLDELVWEHLRIDMRPFEEKLKEQTKSARKYIQQQLPTWKLAREGMPGMPSAKGGDERKATKKGTESTSPWKFDLWVPRALASHLKYKENHPYWSVTLDYALEDAKMTWFLATKMKQKIMERGLWKIFQVRCKLPRITHLIEDYGVTMSGANVRKMSKKFRMERDELAEDCTAIAESYGHKLELPKGASPNNNLRTFIFDVLSLPVVAKSKKTGGPSLNKTALERYATDPEILRPGSPGHTFIVSLRNKRKRDTALSYIKGYRRFWIPLGIFDGQGRQLWFRIHPSLNPTGTDTLRWSSKNPNEQNFSKKEGFNLRYGVAPLPGREFWRFDAENIELRLPAYEVNEVEMVKLFERPKDPPYFGSNHLLVSHILHKRKFEQCINRDDPKNTFLDGRIFKELYDDTLYQWVKNGNFAVTYGAVAESGTADRAYHVQGAQRLIEERFSNIKRLNRQCIEFAQEHGYVETIPDLTVDPDRGYPLQCERNRWGKVIATVPLNYHVQGSACWWMMKAMIRCQALLDKWRKDDKFDVRIIMQVHDELVFDFPESRVDPSLDLVSKEGGKGDSNLWRVYEIKKTMELGGKDFNIPTPVSVGYHPANWSEKAKF